MRMLVRGRGGLMARSLLAGHITQGQPHTPGHSVTLTRPLHQGQPLQDVYTIDSEDDFKNKVMRSRRPVIVNFHADWCEPCHSLRPLLTQIASENNEKLHLAEVLVEDHVDLLQAFEVTAVPAVLGIHRGIVVGKFIGLVSHKEVMNFVEKLLND